jgi:hypothetical protein
MRRLAWPAFFWPLVVLAATEPAQNTPWQIAAGPALLPGEIGSWDDFAIRDVAIVRVDRKWLMLYKGIGLSEDERTCGLGLAVSNDGASWEKPLDEPIVSMNANEEALSPGLVRWNGEFCAAYVAQRLPTNNKDLDLIEPRVEVASSEDGWIWQPRGKAGISFKVPKSIFLRVGFYADSSRLHLWWIGADEKKDPVLCHSVSRDGSTWSKPNMQPASGIDSREILGVRAYPSGDFFVLVYLVRLNPNEVHVVTKISRDAISWQAKGPPEFVLPDSRNIAMPEMVFTSDGARLFYSETRFAATRRSSKTPQRGAVLRTAFCPKSAYGK